MATKKTVLVCVHPRRRANVHPRRRAKSRSNSRAYHFAVWSVAYPQMMMRGFVIAGDAKTNSPVTVPKSVSADIGRVSTKPAAYLQTPHPIWRAKTTRNNLIKR